MYSNVNFPRWSVIGPVLLVLLCINSGSAQVPRDQLFPFGPSNGDSTLKCNDCSSPLIHLKFPYKFFNTTYDQVYVNTHGSISFKSGVSILPPKCDSNSVTSRSSHGPLIAPFWSYFYNSESIHFRESTDPTIILKASREVKKAFPDVHKNIPLNVVFITTWRNQKSYFYDYRTNALMAATFQAILTTDGLNSFAIFYYNNLTWTADPNKSSDGEYTYEKYPGVVGFTAGEGHPFHEVLGNCNNPILEIAKESNIGETGKWVFRVDRGFGCPACNNKNTDIASETIMGSPISISGGTVRIPGFITLCSLVATIPFTQTWLNSF